MAKPPSKVIRYLVAFSLLHNVIRVERCELDYSTVPLTVNQLGDQATFEIRRPLQFLERALRSDSVSHIMHVELLQADMILAIRPLCFMNLLMDEGILPRYP